MTETQTTETTAADEGVEITPTGLIHLAFDGNDYWLRRPKIGEMRRLEEAVVEVAQLQLGNIGTMASRIADAAQEAAPPEGETAAEGSDAELVAEVTEAATEATDREQEVVKRLLDWWQEMVATLERSHQRLPEAHDELPPWLANFDLVAEVRRAWRALPWLAAPRR